MHWIRAAAVVALTAAVSAAGRPASGAEHDAAFWRAIATNKYALPAGADVRALSAELADLLASPDPELRDEIAYSTLASWIYQQKLLDAAALRPLADRLLANLTAHVGERDTDAVFRRSFSALTLSVIVARDNVDAVLDADAWRRIDAAALAYLAAEQDVRGYDERNGWMHSAAHTADLLKFLGRSRYLDAAGQRRILDAIGAKLTTAPVVFAFGEDERYARAILSLTARKDFDDREFAAWTARTKPALAEPPTVAQLRAIQNWKNVLAKLEVLLSNEAQPSEAAIAARTALRAALKTLY